MATRKSTTKKLTNCGAGVCVMVFIALIFSLAAALGELIVPLIYGQFYTVPMEHFLAKDIPELLNVYHAPIIMSLFSLIVFIWAVGAKKAQKLGNEFAVINIFLPIAVCYPLAMSIIKSLANGRVQSEFSTQYDSDKFRMACELAVFGLPVIGGILMIIAGFAVMSRLGKVFHEAKIPYYHKSGKFENPEGFMNKPLETDPVNSPEPVSAPIQQPEPTNSYAPQPDQGFAINTDPAPEVMQEFAPIPEPKKPTVLLCPECGELVQPDEIFCSNCGHKM